jgi:PEP-CTERM motif-containing protein
MNSFIRALVLVFALAALMTTANSAYADSFNFAFSGTFFGGAPISASGTFTTNPLSGGSYLITGISGTMNGQLMTLIAPGNPANDNLLFPSAPFIDSFGVSFLAPFLTNIEFNTTDPADPLGYILEPGGPFCSGVSISFSVSPSTVPEPATLILFGSGIFAVGAAWRRKRLK